MMFLNGLLAGFAVLGSVPIIIHLLNRSRFRIIEWGAMEFILRTLQKNSRRLQLRDIILMILRTLAIVLAALALARPTIADGGFSLFGVGGGVNAVIIIDNGLSMQCRDANETRFEVGVKTAREILKGLPRGSAATLVMLSDIAEAEVAEPTQDLAYLEQLLDKAQASEGGTDIAAGLSEAWDILEPIGGGAREIYLIGDLQARGWPESAERGWRDLIGRMQGSDGLRLYLADVGDDASGNVTVERIAFTDEIIGTDGVSTLVATLRNHGTQAATNVPVDLLIDDGRGMRSAATAVVDSLDRTAQVRLDARFDQGGRHRIEVRSGPDRLEADNVRRTVVDVVDHVRVLVVDGSGDGGSTQSVAFLRAALAPASLLDSTGIEDEEKSDRIELTVASPAQLAGLRLDDFEAVILADVPAPSEALAEGLRAYVAAGNGLITLLGQGVRSETYATFVARGLLPGDVGPDPKRYAREDDLADPGATFSTDQLIHPIVTFFADKETQPFLAQPRVRVAWPLAVPAQEAGQASDHAVVLRLADGAPAITASRVGRGMSVAYTMGCDKSWSDLPLRPAFLMLLRRTIQLVVLGDRPRLSVEVHEPVSQAISAREATDKAVVRFPPGEERSLTPVTREDGSVRLEFSETKRAGFVDFVQGERTYSFAVNPQGDESDLTRIAREAAEERLAPLRIAWLTAGDDVAARLEQGRFGREIWPILLTLAICCLIAETILALRWAPRGG